jgi:hypothetical protein
MIMSVDTYFKMNKSWLTDLYPDNHKPRGVNKKSVSQKDQDLYYGELESEIKTIQPKRIKVKKPLQNISKFINAGNATFTILHKTTNKHFTFKISAPKPKYEGEIVNIKFVSVLTGPDNWANYSYLGMITKDQKFIRTKGTKISDEAMSMKAFKWFWRNQNSLPEDIEVYHEGRCGRCGRKLTVPESIKSGFGPECAGKI